MDIGAGADADVVYVAADYGAGPDAGVGADDHVADDYGGGVDVGGGGDFGVLAAIGSDHAVGVSSKKFTTEGTEFAERMRTGGDPEKATRGCG